MNDTHVIANNPNRAKLKHNKWHVEIRNSHGATLAAVNIKLSKSIDLNLAHVAAEVARDGGWTLAEGDTIHVMISGGDQV